MFFKRQNPMKKPQSQQAETQYHTKNPIELFHPNRREARLVHQINNQHITYKYPPVFRVFRSESAANPRAFTVKQIRKKVPRLFRSFP